MNFFTFPLSIVLTCVLNTVSVSCQGNTYNSTIKFFIGPTLSDFVSYDLRTAHNVADNPNFQSSKRTMIFFHGMMQSPTTTSSQTLLNAYLVNGFFNILALDWSIAASSSIFPALVAQTVGPLGIEVALFIDKLILQKGVPFSKIHLVGHSMGAHLAGSAGKYTVAWSGSTKYIDRITGLDPAYYAVDFLQWRYARFVDIIHTDGTVYGTDQNTGHVDFHPNNGVSPQPGCPEFGTCSHIRAIDYYAESVVRVNRTNNFLSVNRQNPNIIISMGLDCPTSNVQGYYDLTTNAASWFSKS